MFSGDLPEVTDFPTPSVTGRQQRTGSLALPARTQIVGLPTADAAIGIFRGVPLGLTNVGGIDLLVSATYVPEIGDADDDIRIKPERSAAARIRRADRAVAGVDRRTGRLVHAT